MKNSCTSFSQTLAHVNSKTEIRQWDRRKIDKSIGTQTPAGVLTEYSPLGTARITAQLCPDRAMIIVEVVHRALRQPGYVNVNS